jgi:hypothetical protein
MADLSVHWLVVLVRGFLMCISPHVAAQFGLRGDICWLIGIGMQREVFRHFPDEDLVMISRRLG